MLTADAAVGPLQASVGCGGAREIILTSLVGRVSRLIVTEPEAEAVENSVALLGLHLVRSAEKYVTVADEGKGGYSNTFAEEHPQDHPEARRILYVGMSVESATAAMLSEEDSDDNSLGEDLRYPTCCVNWYAAAWPVARQEHQGDLFPLSQGRSVPHEAGDALLNFGANYFGAGWTSFFPCSLTCSSASYSLAREREMIESVAPGLAGQLDSHALRAIAYTERRGIAQLEDSNWDPGTQRLRYDPAGLTITLDDPDSQAWTAALVRGDGLRQLGTYGFEVMRGGAVLHRETSAGAFVRWFEWK